MGSAIGKIVGGGLFIAGVAAIWCWPNKTKRDTFDEPIRPVMSALAESGQPSPELRFPGVIEAITKLDLAFQVGGRLTSFSLRNNQRVKKGEVLAKLDSQDFENAVDVARAELERNKLTLARYQEAAKQNAISKEELSKAETAVKTSQLALEQAERNLGYTVLTAPFDAIVADNYPDEHGMIVSGQKIVTLLDVSRVKVKVSMPETLVINSKAIECVEHEDGRIDGVSVVFDSFPGKNYPAHFVEFTAQADSRTQVYHATYVVDPPDELTLLPGMSATIVVSRGAYSLTSPLVATGVLIPASAVAVASDGSWYVYVLEKSANPEQYRVYTRTVVPGHRSGDRIAIKEGLSAGERVATAGLTLLKEGRIVTLFEKDAK